QIAAVDDRAEVVAVAVLVRSVHDAVAAAAAQTHRAVADAGRITGVDVARGAVVEAKAARELLRKDAALVDRIADLVAGAEAIAARDRRLQARRQRERRHQGPEQPARAHPGLLGSHEVLSRNQKE